MKKSGTPTNALPLEKLVEASRKRPLLYTAAGHDAGNTGPGATRNQRKHELFLTFMDNAKHRKPKPAKAKPRLLSALLSLFF